MILWLILTLMTVALAIFVAAPFLKPVDKSAAVQSSDLGIFRDQLAEVEREATASLIEPAAAEQARTEIKRRMLAADKAAAADGAARVLTGLEYRFAFLATLAVSVLGAALLYTVNGSPAVPSSVPGAAMQQADAAVASSSASKEPTLSDVDTMIAKLESRLQQSPGDAKGWMMLAWSYLRTERYPKALEAYRKAAGLEPKSPDPHVGLADAMIQAASGKVTAEASAELDQALALDAKEPRARFLKGLAKSQAGDAKAALADWIGLLKETGADAQWVTTVREQIDGLAKQSGIDVSADLAALPATAAPAPVEQPGPSAADVAASQSMSESDRNAMIKGMVDRLAAKLDANPRDSEGWIKLMRSRKVMGDAEAAKAALKKSLEIFSDTPAEQAKLKAAAGELGIAL